MASMGDAKPPPPRFVALQPIAIADHFLWRNSTAQEEEEEEEQGGSHKISQQSMHKLLFSAPSYTSAAGGSAANTTRALASGFGVTCGIIGAVAEDEWGGMVLSSLRRHAPTLSVDKMRIRAVNRGDQEGGGSGHTGRCAITVDRETGQRTMRTCFNDDTTRLGPGEISSLDFEGAEVAFVSGYALYGPGLLERAVALAREGGCKVALDLASFEIVRAYRSQLLGMITKGEIDYVFGNEDEARELFPELSAHDATTANRNEAIVRKLIEHCSFACITVGNEGCVAAEAATGQLLQSPAHNEIDPVDTTGAGDAFQAGFIYGIMTKSGLERCCHLGNLAGAAAIQNLGAEVHESTWKWVRAHMVHGERAAELLRSSAKKVNKELILCYELIRKFGRGVVYYGSARLKQGNPHFERARKLSSDIAIMLECTTWSGGGPGMMQAATLGAQDVGRQVGGIRIKREAGTNVLAAAKPIVPVESSVVCQFLSARKVALVDAGVRMTEEDRTAYIYLPGGVGTMDEFFELLTLVQLNKLGTKFEVPLILVNYDNFYAGLLKFLDECCTLGTLGKKEYNALTVCNTNEEVLDYLKSFYKL